MQALMMRVWMQALMTEGVDAGTDEDVDADADEGVDAGTDEGVGAGTDEGVDAECSSRFNNYVLRLFGERRELPARLK